MHKIELDIEALRRIQVERGLTNPELATAMGLSNRTLYRWLSGETTLGWDRLVKAARALEVEPVDLTVSAAQGETANA